MNNTKFLFVLFFLLLFGHVNSQTIKIALAKYNGGGDWYANPTSLPNLIRFCNTNLGTTIYQDPSIVELGSQEMFNYPFIHLTGHGNILISNQEAKVLRKYLLGGGFLHIDDNYGLDIYVRREMKKVFPEYDFVELPFNYSIYHQKYEFPQGLPKVHEHDGKSPQGFGIFVNNRLLCFYSYECDLGDGWEDASVHNDSEQTRTKALQMGANIIDFVFSGDK